MADSTLDLARLLREMSLLEKVGQLHQVAYTSTGNPSDIRAGKVGSIICATSAFAGNEAQVRVRAREMNRLQEIAVKESRLGIPLLIARDVIHGHRTVAPIPIGQASSWSPDDVRTAAEVAATEAYADGIRWAFAPMMDLARDPRWGRIAEGYGEDPFLAGKMARAVIEGFQGDDMSKPGRVAACAKHFAGYGAAEGGRDYNTAEITPYTLRNLYLPPFLEAVKAGVATIMSCFNEMGGVPATANRRLLTEILKDEWGFEGFVVSDWNAVGELIEHGVADDKAQAAELAINAGVDMDMVANCFLEHLCTAVECGTVAAEVIDEAVMRILTVKADLGLFENPYTDLELAEKTHFTPAHQASVLELAKKSLVMLKNEGEILPIGSNARKIGLFGPLIDAREALNGTWTLDGEARDVITIRDGFLAALRKDQELIARTLPDDAVAQARHCDVAVAVVGEFQGRSGEANSVTRVELPPGQEDWLRAILRTGVPLIVVVLAGRPLCIPWLEENADAILWAWHPGTMGGQAIAETLLGYSSPAGKLPVSFPRATGQIPIYYNHKRTGRPLDAHARGDSRYVDERDSPLYPFGFGLTYTKFLYEDLQVDARGSGFVVSARISNVGGKSGEEIAQLYLRDRASSLARPVKELKGFQRIALEAGGSAHVAFELDRDAFGFYGAGEEWTVEPGEFDVWVGPNSVEGLRGLIELS